MLVLDKTNFETEVLQGQGYILVDFFGDGCAPIINTSYTLLIFHLFSVCNH
jgi:hypothetical protein